jgi:hypothetical protein
LRHNGVTELRVVTGKEGRRLIRHEGEEGKKKKRK